MIGRISGFSLPRIPTVTSVPLRCSSTKTSLSREKDSSTAFNISVRSFTILIPMVDPRFAGFTTAGNPKGRSSGVVPSFISTKLAVGKL